MERVTRRIGETILFQDGKGYSNLSYEERYKLLLTTLANCEDKIGKIMPAYFKVEDWLYANAKDKPVEIKSAILWGALSVIGNLGEIGWDEMRNLYGEFMSHQMNLR